MKRIGMCGCVIMLVCGLVGMAHATSFIAASGVTFDLDMTGDASLDGAVTINESGASVDTRMEGNTDTELFFLDGSADKIGISTTAPSATLDVDGTTKLQDDVTVIDATTGGLTLKAAEGTATLSGATGSITLSVPSGAMLVGAQYRVDTLMTSGDGGTSWTLAYTGGSTAQIGTGLAFTKNTKGSVPFDANAATNITTDVTNVSVTPDSGTFSAGVVRVIVYYWVFTAMDDAS